MDLVLNSTVFLRLNFCAENPLVRQAEKRYQQFQDNNDSKFI